MAVVTRRIGTALVTEHIARVGRTGDTSYATRANHFVNSAYLYCATRFHHHVFDGSDDAALTKGTGSVDLSTLFSGVTPLIVFSVRLLDGSLNERVLEFMEAHQLFARMTTKAAVPEYWTRYENDLYFNVPVEIAYTCRVMAYKAPTAWDLDNACPLEEHWDEAVLEKAAEMAFRATHQFDTAQIHREAFEELAASTGQSLIAQGTLLDSPTESRPAHGGSRG